VRVKRRKSASGFLVMAKAGGASQLGLRVGLELGTGTGTELGLGLGRDAGRKSPLEFSA
jgi:hypothetical protein